MRSSIPDAEDTFARIALYIETSPEMAKMLFVSIRIQLRIILLFWSIAERDDWVRK